MRYSLRQMAALAMTVGTSMAFAEPLYTVETDTIHGVTLFAQQLNEPMLVTVKPQSQATEQGDVEVLNQCLWSVKIDFSAEAVSFSAGKMICIGPKQEVLEAVPVGKVEAFGECVDVACDSYNVAAEAAVVMSLTEPLQFTLQPRNERK